MQEHSLLCINPLLLNRPNKIICRLAFVPHHMKYMRWIATEDTLKVHVRTTKGFPSANDGRQLALSHWGIEMHRAVSNVLMDYVSTRLDLTRVWAEKPTNSDGLLCKQSNSSGQSHYKPQAD